MREHIIRAIEHEKVIAIIRGVEAEMCIRVTDALYAGGIRLAEVTFNQKDPASFENTAQVINAIVHKFGEQLLVGAGTVTTPELVEVAAQAGANYIISPDMNPAVIHRTRELGMVSIPGAMTPTEVLAAHYEGGDFVKLFPAAALGIPYVKAVRAPISHVRLLAVGGVDEKNAVDFLRAGMSGVGIGGNLVNQEWIEAGEFDKITETALTLTTTLKGIW